MEGKYFIKDSNEEINKHEHVIFTFEDNSDLRYHDTRKFGRMNLVLKKDIDSVEGVRKQGIEPIDESLSKEYLYDNFKKRRLPMKTLLLDQTIISGLGNIYADEVLFAAKINPLKIGSDITLEECQRIVDSSKKIIEEAIKCGGTTIKSYTSSLGVTGRFQQNLMAHKRENEECKNCSTIIKRIVVGGRSTYYCENCQK
jgi:formamidopyrimidine-DNA glycosylase